MPVGRAAASHRHSRSSGVRPSRPLQQPIDRPHSNAPWRQLPLCRHSDDREALVFSLVEPGLQGNRLLVSLPKITPADFIGMKKRGEKIAALTAYDYPMARMLDEAGIPFLLVGDSLGMVVLGYPDTTHVTMDEIEHHVRAAARAKPRASLGGDLPYQSYESPEQAIANARRLISAGAEFVKAEGGRSILPQVRAIIAAGIPYCGHLGMLPQHVIEEGGYKIKGRRDEEIAALHADAQALADAGAFAIVLELVLPVVAAEISRRIAIPTIGIGSGPDCDGQILVTHDLIGTFPWFTPRFVKPKLNAATHIRDAVQQWKLEMKADL